MSVTVFTSAFTVVNFLRKRTWRSRSANLVTSRGKRAFSCHPTDADMDLIDFVSGRKKETDMAHLIWKYFVRPGDFVIDATCGNGKDTLALAKLVGTESGGLVYGMDVQQAALQKTSVLLDCTLSLTQRQQVKLFPLCHSKMEDIVPEGASPRLIAFNLGYLPGSNKQLITLADTTLLALKAATRILQSGGLISVISYLGHQGGREEYEAVRSFAMGLSSTAWLAREHHTLNWLSGIVLMLLYKKTE